MQKWFAFFFRHNAGFLVAFCVVNRWPLQRIHVKRQLHTRYRRKCFRLCSFCDVILLFFLGQIEFNSMKQMKYKSNHSDKSRVFHVFVEYALSKQCVCTENDASCFCYLFRCCAMSLTVRVLVMNLSRWILSRVILWSCYKWNTLHGIKSNVL